MADPGADSDSMMPHLRVLLENLSILRPGAPALRTLPADKAAERDVGGTLDFLRRGWIETRVSDYETIGLSSISDETGLLNVTFSGNIWSAGWMEQRLTVARVAKDRFRCWRYHESGGVWGSAVGKYETLRR